MKKKKKLIWKLEGYRPLTVSCKQIIKLKWILSGDCPSQTCCLFYYYLTLIICLLLRQLSFLSGLWEVGMVLQTFFNISDPRNVQRLKISGARKISGSSWLSTFFLWYFYPIILNGLQPGTCALTNFLILYVG